MPCLNCRLIEMGEMACYQEKCPQCNKVPPCKKVVLDELQGARGLGKVYVNPAHGCGHNSGQRGARRGEMERGGLGGVGGINRAHNFREDFTV